MSVLIRKLVPADAEAYRTCRLDALRIDPASFASSYEDEVNEDFRARIEKRKPEDVTFGVFDGERVIGLAGIFREQRLKRQHKMWLVSVFVYPEYRGKGIGHRLVETAIAHARTVDDVARIELGVQAQNEAAKALYRAHGFVTRGTEPECLKMDGKRYDEEHMSLLLADTQQ